mmetsp:Transcript_27856/g.86743  ORF Transcript_27856/g.86743 Transcript_27856/m.86743 type:complete len:184 (-) Transcript_27856:105-656(-)
MFGDLLPDKLASARQQEKEQKSYSVKPGSVLFDRMLWRTNAAGESCDAFDEVRSCDLCLVMGTSLSGLTIDNVAHMAGPLGMPRIVFDMSKTPIESLKEMGEWTPAKDCHLQDPLDISVLRILREMGWLDQIFDFLPQLCLNSLRILRRFLEESPQGVGVRGATLEEAIQKEEQREKFFYQDE